MSSVEPERIHELKVSKAEAAAGAYVLYWMQSSVRSQHNPALEYAIEEANRCSLPLVVCFGLTHGYPEASERHYRFLIEGLAELSADLDARGVAFVLRIGDPAEVAIELAENARSLIMDRGYLRQQRAWRMTVLESVDLPITEVEGDVVIPVATVSNKREYAARTIRPKIHRNLDRFLTPLASGSLNSPATPQELGVSGVDAVEVDLLLAELDIDRSVSSVSHHQGGASQAHLALDRFLVDAFDTYVQNRNQPQTDSVSYLSMYLHFGHISPVVVALRARESAAASGGLAAKVKPAEALTSFLEELIVRRELAFNYAWFEEGYDSYSALPDWARKTLDEHRHDEREFLYSRDELEAAETHDPYWNASMVEMREMGYMHNYMRMYWGKKILEWSETPEDAYESALFLNNKYLLDGRDPNSYTGVGWVFGLHDRAWTERNVFGKIRYMNAAGLKRKADPDAYVRKIAERTGVSVVGAPSDPSSQSTLEI